MKVDVEIDNKNYAGKVVMTPADMPFDANEEIKKSVRIKIAYLPKEIEIGSSASITLVLEKAENVIVLPRNLINNYSGRKYVKVLKNGIPSESDTETGIMSDTEVEIVNGLKEGEKVIVR
jgi:hypothetical protein